MFDLIYFARVKAYTLMFELIFNNRHATRPHNLRLMINRGDIYMYLDNIIPDNRFKTEFISIAQYDIDFKCF